MKRIALPFLLLILLTEKYYSNGVGGGTNSEIMFTTELNGANEVSSISTIASGTAWAILSDDRSHALLPGYLCSIVLGIYISLFPIWLTGY